MNQFEMKDTCIQFAIKIKLNLKVEESAEIAVLICCEINNNAPSFSLDLPEAHLTFEAPTRKCFQK